jgi:outer membrane immunogenic protein
MKLTAKLLLATASVAALSSGAMAADLMAPAPPAAVVAPPAGSWDGPYIGANIGYSWGFADHVPATGTAAGNDVTLTGYELGGQIGYLFHLSDSIVGGVEGSIDWSNESGTNVLGFAPAGTFSQTINWEGRIVAKLGFDVGGNILPYIDGGIAFANSTRKPVSGGTPAPNNTQTGWTVGAGLEAQLADKITGFVAYNYADYGTATYNTGGTPPHIHLTDSIVKVGLNYHF